MATRFLKDTDYDFQVKKEILNLLDGTAPGGIGTATKLLAAEKAALKQMKHWLAGRYDVAVIFAAHTTGEDTRDAMIVMVCVDFTLYHLYSQTPNRDVPVHRAQRYQDGLDWLKQAGTGEIKADLPALPLDDFSGDVRISSREPEDHRW